MVTIEVTGERNYNGYVTEYGGRYYVARWVESAKQYQGPLRDEVRKLSGCSGFMCGKRGDLPGVGGHSYSTHAAARKAARKMYEPFHE